jgi:hypothetical protein
MMCRRSARQEALWSANTNLKKVTHKDGASALERFRRALFRPLYVSTAPVKVVGKMWLALRAGGSVCGSTLTVLVEPGTWLVRKARQDF